MWNRLLLLSALSIAISTHSSAEEKPATPVQIEHFEKKIRPLLLEHCSKCHEDKKPKGGLSLATRKAMMLGGDSGLSVMPGHPEKSLLIEAVKYTSDLKMPPKAKLRDDEIQLLSDWVKAGALWPASDAATTAETPKNGPLFTPEQRQFWAFQPVKKPTPPQNGAKHPIDAFLKAKQQEAKLSAAPPADKRTLLLRVTWDLIGLPPTPQELDAFLQDTSPDAFAKVVDRLLANPAYGERWGRHWLDVARYADSNGLDENTAFANAWRYRDYVVKSFNADKPFNTFLLEQIAGDLLPKSEYAAVQADRYTALGYLALGAKVLAEPDKQKMLIDIADEQLDTLGKGVMGLTLGCARCHDHKFDPIPTRDYYSLLSIFTSTRTMQNLNTVAKTFERSLTGAETPEVLKTRTRLDKARTELRKKESEFGKTPVTEKEKRHQIHLQAEKLRAEIKQIEGNLPFNVSVLSVEEGSGAAYNTAPRNLYVQGRGNYTSPTDEAPAQLLRIITGEKASDIIGTKPNPADTKVANKIRYGQVREQSGRLELAQWLASPEHPLTARVFVNRVWQHHFGEGIVRSPDNFGKLGNRPTHPELLDWLATEFTAHKWSIKKLHRTILLSQAYQQASGTPPASDTENNWLSVMPRRRMEAEAIRDAMLAVAGTLDRTMGGSLFTMANFQYVGNVKYDTLRRSIYLPVVRGKTYDFLLTYDFPDPVTMNGKRVNTVVAPQALFMLNNPFVLDQAEAFAKRMFTAGTAAETRLRFAYREAFLRDPTSEERTRAEQFIQAFQKGLEADEKESKKRELVAWRAFAQSIFASNEFVFRE